MTTVIWWRSIDISREAWLYVTKISVDIMFRMQRQRGVQALRSDQKYSYRDVNALLGRIEISRQVCKQIGSDIQRVEYMYGELIGLLWTG